MKHDKLEQFILDNRSDFDDLAPSAEPWKQIKADIRPVRRINWTGRLVRVAAAVVIFVSSYIFIDYNFNKDNGTNELAEQNAAEMYENIPVLAEARAYYSGQISNMEAEVYRIAGQNSPLKAEIDTELQEQITDPGRDTHTTEKRRRTKH